MNWDNNSHNGVILIIDDDVIALHVIVDPLECHGFIILTARDGESGLRRAKYALPDLILLDVDMPKMDGFETCRRLKADPATAHIPVIFLTILDSVEDKVSSFAIGGVDYITKPIQYEETIARITMHLRVQHLQRQLRESESRYRAILNSSSQSFLLIDPDYRIQAFNEVACNDVKRITGMSLEHGMVMDEIIHTYGLPDAQSACQQVLQDQQPVSAETRAIALDQQIVRFLVTLNPVHTTGSNILGVCLSASDISVQRRMKQEKLVPKAAFKHRHKLDRIIGKSPAMQTVHETIIRAAVTDMNVLISGETGVGKELVAQCIHDLSERREKPFIVVNCGAITDTLFEREFFGHRKGAFTGADRDSTGYLGAAHTGTLFLDEVGELSAAMQVKLLRALETGEYIPLGEHQPRRADFRILSATNRNLYTMLNQNLLREDFYYRLNVIRLTVPPLRQRPEDIPLLIEHFLATYAKNHSPATMPAILLRQLCAYTWPGNVRQLQNTLQCYLATGQIDLPDAAMAPTAAQPPELLPGLPPETGLIGAVEQVEQQLILNALRRTSGRKEKAADLLRINRKTLYKKMKRYGL